MQPGRIGLVLVETVCQQQHERSSFFNFGAPDFAIRISFWSACTVFTQVSSGLVVNLGMTLSVEGDEERSEGELLAECN